MPSANLSADQREFIEAQRVGRLATVDEQHRPHIVPICFCLVGDVLYTPVDEKPKRGAPPDLRRLRNIAANPSVQVLFDLYHDDDWARLRFLQIRGVASLAKDLAQSASAIRLLRVRYTQYEHMSLEDRPLMRIAIEHVVEWKTAETLR
jgi:PPOX class probable F420-dependent enzyme